MNSFRDLITRIAPALFAIFGMLLSSASGQDMDAVRKGHHLAATVCAACHVATPDQLSQPILNPPAPSFESIVRRKDITAESLQSFINTTHRDLDRPKGMPNPELMDYQVKEVIAYILSLRK